MRSRHRPFVPKPPSDTQEKVFLLSEEEIRRIRKVALLLDERPDDEALDAILNWAQEARTNEFMLQLVLCGLLAPQFKNGEVQFQPIRRRASNNHSEGW